MKYWRGYLVAAIAAACSWALKDFVKNHSELIDMIYPYVTRMIQDYLAKWSSDVAFCVWQMLLLVLIVLGLATIVLMIVLRWNPIQVIGWMVAAVFCINFVTTAMHGLNQYTDNLASDLRLENMKYKYSTEELEAAAVFYRDKANELANQVNRDEQGNVIYPEFSELATQAEEGFKVQTYEYYHPIFAGSTIPVKELGWSDYYTTRGIADKLVPLTGEAAVNPEAPAVIIPYAMCRVMACRMSITSEQSSNFAAFLACDANSSVEFRYSAYLMAYRYCHNQMKELKNVSNPLALDSLENGENANLKRDLKTCSEFFGKNEKLDKSVCDILVIWHIEKYVLPLLQEEEVAPFDPFDENAVDLTGLVGA